MTIATAASIFRGERGCSLTSRTPRESERSTALDTCRASRASPSWRNWWVRTRAVTRCVAGVMRCADCRNSVTGRPSADSTSIVRLSTNGSQATSRTFQRIAASRTSFSTAPMSTIHSERSGGRSHSPTRCTWCGWDTDTATSAVESSDSEASRPRTTGSPSGIGHPALHRSQSSCASHSPWIDLGRLNQYRSHSAGVVCGSSYESAIACRSIQPAAGPYTCFSPASLPFGVRASNFAGASRWSNSRPTFDARPSATARANSNVPSATDPSPGANIVVVSNIQPEAILRFSRLRSTTWCSRFCLGNAHRCVSSATTYVDFLPSALESADESGVIVPRPSGRWMRVKPTSTRPYTSSRAAAHVSGSSMNRIASYVLPAWSSSVAKHSTSGRVTGTPTGSPAV